jgi:2-oxo-4-hydroxy-4-carboxy-5-ureidoimidazoline decarboxylase
MISIPQLNAAPAREFVAALGGIYEHSVWVPQAILGCRPFPDRDALVTAMRAAVDQAADTQKLDLIRAHPDLAGKLARAGALTDSSTREQAGLGLDRLDEAEYTEFSRRNEAYRQRFGFPFIICARLTTKSGVLAAFEERLGHTRDQEISEAIHQIHHIARLRLEDLIPE